MIFFNAKCTLCGQRHDKPDNLIAFTVRHQALELIDLRGEQPWSGVRVVCRRCVRFLREATDASEADKLADAYRQIGALRTLNSNQRVMASQGEHYRRAAQAFELAMLSLARRLPKDDPAVIKARRVYAEYDPHGCLRAPGEAEEECPACIGDGEVEEISGPGKSRFVPCEACGGTGKRTIGGA